MNLSESGVGRHCRSTEQVFTVVNDERIDRGLPPIDYMTAQLNTYAQGGANAATRPDVPLVADRRCPHHVRRLHLGRAD